MYNELDILGNQLIKNTRDISRQNSQRRNQTTNSNGIIIPAIVKDEFSIYYFNINKDLIYFNKFEIKFLSNTNLIALPVFYDVKSGRSVGLQPYLLAYYGSIFVDEYGTCPNINQNIDLLRIASDMKGLGLEYDIITSPGLKMITTRFNTSTALMLELSTTHLNR